MRWPPPFTLFFAAPLALLACRSAPPPATARVPPPPSAARQAPPTLQLPGDVRPTRYALALVIAPERDDFSGSVDITVQLDRPRTTLWLHGRDLDVKRASVEARGARLEAHYRQVNADGVVELTLPAPIGPGAATLHFEWRRGWDQQLVGLYRARAAGVPYAFTQFEAIDARRAFPCFDEPVFKTPFDVTLTVPADDVAVANTSAVEEARGEGGMKRVRFATTRPLPTYLLVFAVGPFDVVTPPPLPPNAIRKRPLAVRGIAPRGRGRELGFALRAGGELLAVLEQYFGIEYPYDKLDHIAVPDYAYGAMENAGGITYREDILLFDEGVTPELTKVSIASVMAHEMAHQWFGDLVTLPWWTDAWLNESFATWMAAHAMMTWRPDLRADLILLDAVQGAMATDALVSARRIRQPLERIVDLWNQFDRLTYQKGAGVLGMFERWVGPERFREGIHQYLADHRDGTGDTDALLAALTAAAGKDVTGPFKSFLEQAGVPLVEAKLTCGGDGARLALHQRRYLPLGSKGAPGQTWQVPVCARYGTGAEERESCTLLGAADGVLPLAGGGCPEWVMPNAEAAGYYRWSLDGAALPKLIAAGYPRLGVRERVSLASNLGAALRAGTLDAGEVLGRLQPLAADPSGYVATEPIAMVRFAWEHLAGDTLRPRVEEYARALYGPAARRLGWRARPKDSDETRRFRDAVMRFLLGTARDPRLRQEAAALARAYLSGGALHPSAVDPDLSGVVTGVAIQEGDRKIFDAAIDLATRADNAGVRARLLGAIASAWDPELSRRALALSLDPRLRKNERLLLLAGQMSQRETREAAWTWLQASYDALLPLLPLSYGGRLPLLAAAFCDARHLAEMHTFFAARVEKVPAGPRNLAQAEEDVRLCIAAREAQSASARAFFTARDLPDRSAGTSGAPRRSR